MDQNSDPSQDNRDNREERLKEVPNVQAFSGLVQGKFKTFKFHYDKLLDRSNIPQLAF